MTMPFSLLLQKVIARINSLNPEETLFTIQHGRELEVYILLTIKCKIVLDNRMIWK